jgi:beta-lactamase class D
VFRSFLRQNGNPIEVGGKTGSLTGTSPQGKYDWFVGYAKSPSGKRIAFASLAIHGEFWRVKAAMLARQAIEHYFADELPLRSKRRIASRSHVAL